MFEVICSSMSAGRCTVCSSQNLPCDLLWSGSAARSQRRRWNRRRTTWVTSACPLPRTPPAGEHGGDSDKRQLYCVCTGATWDVCENQSCMYILLHVIYTVCVAGASTFTLFVIYAHSSGIKAPIMSIFLRFIKRRVFSSHSDFCETRSEPIGFSVLAPVCCSGGQTAVQLRAAGHGPVCFLSAVEFIWAPSYEHMNGPQCAGSVLTSPHQRGWDTLVKSGTHQGPARSSKGTSAPVWRTRVWRLEQSSKLFEQLVTLSELFWLAAFLIKIPELLNLKYPRSTPETPKLIPSWHENRCAPNHILP